MPTIDSATIYAAGYIRPANKCGCGLVLEGKSPGYRVSRAISHQLGQSSAVQAELHAAVGALSSLRHRKIPVTLVLGNPGVYKLLEKRDGKYVAPIKGNEQLSRGLRALADGYERLTVVLDKGHDGVKRAVALAKAAATDGGSDGLTQFTRE